VKRPLLIVLLILFIDQASKIWIKTNMFLGQEFIIFPNWFIIHFTENNGMAFGIELEVPLGKLILSSFRMLAIAALGYGLYYVTKKKMHRGFITCVALVFAGALGNLIDSIFYGVIFEHSYNNIAAMFPAQGYAPLMHGRVVDMLYFPIIESTFPSWVPFWGGEEFVFFRPVFNIADASISTGMIAFLVFQNRYFPDGKMRPAAESASEEEPTTLSGESTAEKE
jgi:signal peptidase II